MRLSAIFMNKKIEKILLGSLPEHIQAEITEYSTKQAEQLLKATSVSNELLNEIISNTFCRKPLEAAAVIAAPNIPFKTKMEVLEKSSPQAAGGLFGLMLLNPLSKEEIISVITSHATSIYRMARDSMEATGARKRIHDMIINEKLSQETIDIIGEQLAMEFAYTGALPYIPMFLQYCNHNEHIDKILEQKEGYSEPHILLAIANNKKLPNKTREEAFFALPSSETDMSYSIDKLTSTTPRIRTVMSTSAVRSVLNGTNPQAEKRYNKVIRLVCEESEDEKTSYTTIQYGDGSYKTGSQVILEEIMKKENEKEGFIRDAMMTVAGIIDETEARPLEYLITYSADPNVQEQLCALANGNGARQLFLHNFHISQEAVNCESGNNFLKAHTSDLKEKCKTFSNVDEAVQSVVGSISKETQNAIWSTGVMIKNILKTATLSREIIENLMEAPLQIQRHIVGCVWDEETRNMIAEKTAIPEVAFVFHMPKIAPYEIPLFSHDDKAKFMEVVFDVYIQNKDLFKRNGTIDTDRLTERFENLFKHYEETLTTDEKISFYRNVPSMLAKMLVLTKESFRKEMLAIPTRFDNLQYKNHPVLQKAEPITDEMITALEKAAQKREAVAIYEKYGAESLSKKQVLYVFENIVSEEDLIALRYETRLLKMMELKQEAERFSEIYEKAPPTKRESTIREALKSVKLNEKAANNDVPELD